MADKRLVGLIQAVEAMKQGRFGAAGAFEGDDEVARLGRALAELGQGLQRQFAESRALMTITEQVNAGMVLEEVLGCAYDSLRSIIPYDRIGFSLLEEDGKTVRAVWARSRVPEIKLGKGYTAPMAGSSLQQIIETGRPRILNDLEAYLREHPGSDSTRKIVEEGMRSSLTCPLVAMGSPIGFLFFSSLQTDTYKNVHVDLFLKIAGQLSVIAEKGRLYQRLVELNDLKNKFLGIAAHDLRSPLTVIKGNLDLMRDELLGAMTPQQHDAVAKMLEYCEGMLTLINDLLDVSAIESGAIELRRKDVDIREFLEKAVAFNELLARAKSMTLKADLAPNLPKISIDPERMNQVVNNLIANAIKFSAPGTAITMTARVIGGEVRIAVADQGQGIPEEELSKLFDFYAQTRIKSTRGEPGSGLGLAIVKRMVEAHGGRILVESQLNKGSTFTVILPLK